MRSRLFRGPPGRWSARIVHSAILLLVLASSMASAGGPKRVLVLSPFGHDVAPFSALTAQFTTTLAGIVANAVLSLIEVHELKELWRMRRSEFAIAAVCLVSVLALGPLRAVLIAFLLSTIDVIRRASRPETPALLEAPDGSHFVPADSDEAVSTSGLAIYRFGAPLYFANAILFLEEIERLLDEASTPVRWFVLDAEAMVDIDTTGAGVMGQVIDLMAKRKIIFAVSRADSSFRSWMDKYDLLALIPAQHFYPTNRHAAEAFKLEMKAASDEAEQI